MAAKLTRLTYKMAVKPHLVVQSCTICSSRSRRQVRKLLDAPSYIFFSCHGLTLLASVFLLKVLEIICNDSVKKYLRIETYPFTLFITCS